MRILKLIDRFIYNTTKKPEHYKRVKNPPKTVWEKITRPQEARQQQFNNWCKRKGVYCGSYLPENPNVLTKKGWNELTSLKNTTGDHRDFQRKSTKQMVRYEEKRFRKGRWEDEHYHWENAKSVVERRKKPNTEKYIDRYGNVCADKSPESHLAPKYRDYNYRK